jgi:NAD-dependent SIR2 family protein deacetylase
MDTIYYEYPTSRDVVFVLGAGASAPDGVPLQKDLLPQIYRPAHPELRASSNGRIVLNFLHRWFPRAADDSPFASLEEVFGFIDVLLARRQGLPDGFTTEVLANIRVALVNCIHYVIDRARKSPATNYRAFWETVATSNRNVAIVTLNYDTTLEEAFDPLYPNRALIDYRLGFLNYDEPSGIQGHHWWIDAAKPINRWPGGDPVPIKVLKLHGSLNWKYCPSCREVLLTPWDTSIDLDQGGFVRVDGASCFEPEIVSPLRCPYCVGPFEALVAPPSHSKDLAHPVLTQLLTEAMRELRRSKRIVFIGYSFPEADVHIRAMLAKEIASQEVVVIDPSPAATSLARYRALAPRLRLLESDFAAVVKSNQLSRLLAAG